jgi:hypothetical protein
MFGYVTVGDNQLTEEEYRIFLSYYCGVCKSIGKYTSQAARLGLSYDITFLALVLSSLESDGGEEYERCIIHPIKKRRCIKSDKSVDYAASAGVILSYLKLKDDWADDRSIKSLFGIAAFYWGCKKADKKLSGVYKKIQEKLSLLSGYEKNGCSSIDDTAGVFGEILEILFTPPYIKDEKMRRKLAWLGYNLGRWIYIMDAVSDLESDIKTGAYNTFKEMGYYDKKSCAEDMELSLTLTLEGIASAFELINFKRNRDIIGKIIYLSLKEKQRQILYGEKGKE